RPGAGRGAAHHAAARARPVRAGGRALFRAGARREGKPQGAVPADELPARRPGGAGARADRRALRAETAAPVGAPDAAGDARAPRREDAAAAAGGVGPGEPGLNTGRSAAAPPRGSYFASTRVFRLSR